MFKAAVLAAAVVSGVLVAASVITALWFPARAHQHGQAPLGTHPGRAELLGCNDQVSALLTDLGSQAAQAVDVPRDGSGMGSVSTRWAQYSREWRGRWQAVDEHCRFSSQSSGELGAGYDRMARVHDGLRAMHLRYDNLVRRFENEQAGELASMRRALAKSRAALERRSE